MPRKKAITPYQGTQLSLLPEETESIDFTSIDAKDRTGSHCDNFEAKPKWGPRNKKKMDPTWGPDPGYELRTPQPGEKAPVYDLSPIVYERMNFRGIRGGLVGTDLNGYYIGPGYSLKKGEKTIAVRPSALAGPIVFTPGLKIKKYTPAIVAELDAYFKEWKQWFLEQGVKSEACQDEFAKIRKIVREYGGFTLLHHCRAIDPVSVIEKKIHCPSEIISEYCFDDF